MNRESVKKIKGYDEKIFSVDEENLAKREPFLAMICDKGLQLQNYRCRQLFCCITVYAIPCNEM